jgi:hypothetical protein
MSSKKGAMRFRFQLWQVLFVITQLGVSIGQHLSLDRFWTRLYLSQLADEVRENDGTAGQVHRKCHVGMKVATLVSLVCLST